MKLLLLFDHRFFRAQDGQIFSDKAYSHRDRKSTRLNSSHLGISYAVFCLKKADRKSTRLNSSHLGISYAVFCLHKEYRSEEHTSEIQSLRQLVWRLLLDKNTFFQQFYASAHAIIALAGTPAVRFGF